MSKPASERTQTITFSMPVGELERLNFTANHLGMSRSRFIRSCLTQYLDMRRAEPLQFSIEQNMAELAAMDNIGTEE